MSTEIFDFVNNNRTYSFNNVNSTEKIMRMYGV